MPVTNHGAAVCAIHLQTEHVVTVHSARPGRMNLRHNAALKLERDAGRVIAGACVSFTVFVKPFWNLGAGQGGERPNRGEQFLEQVMKMREHVEQQTTTVFRSVIPRWTL